MEKTEKSLGFNSLIDKSVQFKACARAIGEYVGQPGGIKLPKKVILDQTPHTKIFCTADLRKTTMGLSRNALRLFVWFVFQAVSGEDYIKFNLKAYMDETGIAAENTVKAGLKELIRYEFIAETGDKRVYWINPLRFFKGDRLAKYKANVRIVNEFGVLS